MYDSKTNLIWSKKGADDYVNWDEAMSFIGRLNNDSFLGFKDWRMPTKEELSSLVKHAKKSGYGNSQKTIATYLNQFGFNVIDENYWTNNQIEESSDFTEDISFTDGKISSVSKDCQYGPCGGSYWTVLPVRGAMSKRIE